MEDRNHILEQAVLGAFRRSLLLERKEENYKERTFKPNEVLWVSDLLFCGRRKAYEFHSKITVQDDKGFVKQAIGNLLHSKLAKELRFDGQPEVSLMKSYGEEYLLKGRVDYLLRDAVLEFKTITYDDVPQSPRKYDEDQLQLYLWLSDRKIGYIVYISSFKGTVKSFEIHRDEEKVENLLRKGIQIVKGFKGIASVEPDPTYPWICRDCPVNYCEHRR